MMLEMVADPVCLELGVRGRVLVWRFSGCKWEGNFGKRRRGKRWFAWIRGEGYGKAKGKQNGARCEGLARTDRKSCEVSRGDNGCVALSWKRESARLASFKVAESRSRHSCWDRQVGSQPMEANIRPCEYT